MITFSITLSSIQGVPVIISLCVKSVCHIFIVVYTRDFRRRKEWKH